MDSIRIRREGGFSGFDVFVFLMYYFAAGTTCGLRPFRQRVGEWGDRLAAVVGRTSLPTAASVSRALSQVTSEEVRELSFRLLVLATGVADVMRHPAATAKDAVGQHWHVFHKDGTRKVYRQRALPRDGADVPAPRRRTHEAAAGYSGRKRGDVQMHRLVLQHAGSSAWLMSEVAPGNGRHDEELQLALDTVRKTASLLEHPVERCVVCMDGEDGWVPSFHACRRQNVPFVTRLNRPELLDMPDVRQKMRQANWFVVPDSGSGPMRAAMDLGWVKVRPGSTTRDKDGNAYDPVSVRVVVSRFHQPDSERGRGRKIGDTRYELYATTLEASAWPAPEVVHLYYGRTAQENRFLQEDRELGLDRIFSYRAAGQSFAALVGLMLWNLQLVMGVRADPIPTTGDVHPESKGLQPATACDIPDLDVVDPAEEDEAHSGAETELAELEAELLEQAHNLGIADKLPTGWTWDRHEGLRCPNNLLLTLSCVANQARPALVFQQKGQACGVCPIRGSCLQSANKAKGKQHQVPVEPGPTLDEVRRLLDEVQPKRRLARSVRALENKRRRAKATPPLCIVSRERSSLARTGCVAAPFLPAQARQQARAFAADLEVFVTVSRPPPQTRRHAYLAASSAVRQHRRQSWEERQHRNDQPPGARVSMVLAWPPGHPALENAVPSRG